MKLQQFSGGLATRLAPQLLQQDQGVEFENIDTSTGVLEPVKTALATGIALATYAHYYLTGATWVSSATPTTYLEYQGVLYSATGSGRPLKTSNGVTRYLGIVPPQVAPILNPSRTIVQLDTFRVTSDTTQGNLSIGKLAYRVYTESTFYGWTQSAPIEIIVDGVDSTDPTSTTLASVTSLAQVDSTDSETAVTIGIMPTYPEEQNVFTGYTGYGAYSTLAYVTPKQAPTSRAILFDNFEGLACDSTRQARIFRYYKDEWRLVGSVRMESLSVTLLDSVADISSQPLLENFNYSTPFNGTYQYVYTYYNATDGTESAPSPLSAEAEAKGGTISVAVTASTDPQVTGIRVYRVGGKRTLFAMVAELANSTVTYTDSLSDTEMDGRLLESDNYYDAPSGLKFLSTSYAMLFGAVDYTLYFTPIGVPNAWPPEYSLKFSSAITGIGAVANGLLVMTATQTFLVTGTGPLSLAVQTLRGDQGCSSHYSIQEVQKGSLVWASNDGLCLSSGSNVESITKQNLGDISLDVVTSAVVDEVYYLHLTDGTTLAWDYRFKPIFKTFNLSLTSVVAANSEIYGIIGGYAVKLFAGSSSEEFTFKSARFAEGSLTEAKTYKKVYVSHDGDIIIDIRINDELVASSTLEGKDSTVIQVPQASQRGYYIQFTLTGTGTVNELEYRVSNRKDG